jgi:uncharacterized protein YcbX
VTDANTAQGNLAVTLSGLWIYPVKSCAGVPIVSAELDAQGGLKGDRQWVVSNTNGEMMWQGGIPRMALVRPVLDAESLHLQAPGVANLAVKRKARGEDREVKIWNEGTRVFDIFPGEDSGPAAQAWLSDFLGQPLRLVRLGAVGLARRTLNPLHVVSRSSLRQLNERLKDQGHPPVEVERFRPNLLIDGAAGALAPFAEENFASVSWPRAAGSPLVRLAESCVRCVMTNIDLHDAAVGKEPLATVARMSGERRPDGPVCFGVYGRGENGGVLTKGEQGWAEIRR